MKEDVHDLMQAAGRLVTEHQTHTGILTELPPKLNLKSNCESLLLGITSGMSCELG